MQEEGSLDYLNFKIPMPKVAINSTPSHCKKS